MTLPTSFGPWYTEGVGSQLPPGANVPMQASAAPLAGQGQLLFLDASGNANVGDGITPGLISAGVVHIDKLCASNPVAGLAKARAWWGFGGMPFSLLVGDGFTAADIGGVPAFDAGGNSIGRKSNVSGSNRSIAGMVYGLNDDGLARFWSGPIAQAIARFILSANNYPMATIGIADASASTATAEKSVSHRPKVHGPVTDISFTGAAVTASNTDYAIVTFTKRDVTGANPVVLGTYDTRITGQGTIAAFVPAAFSLSAVAGALNLLESDGVTITVTKGGAGQVLTGGFLINGKAL